MNNIICRSLRYSSWFFILPVLTTTLLWNIPRFAELKTCFKANNSEISSATICEDQNSSTGILPECELSVCPTQMRKHISYCRDYILIANFVIMVLLPFLLLCILNSRLYHFISKNTIKVTTIRQKRDQRIATILIVIVGVFGCCNIPRVVINLYEVNSKIILLHKMNYILLRFR